MTMSDNKNKMEVVALEMEKAKRFYSLLTWVTVAIGYLG